VRQRALLLSLEVAVPVLVITAWWWLSRDSTSPYFPPLTDIAGAFRQTWLFSHVPTDLAPSLARLAIGYGIAAALGVALGMVLGLVRPASRAFGPLLEFLRAVPRPVVIPVAILVFGAGSAMKVFVIVAGCIWPVLLNTVDGVRGVEPAMLEMSRSYGLRPAQRWREVILPSALPQVFSGLRSALSVAIILMVISEMVASTNGVGYFVLQAERTFAIPEMWSGILLLGTLGYVLNALLVLVERRALAWHRGFRASQLATSRDTG
jgi:ABC-type nitrate/sulfonate/bicarbonate transport system permease component